MAKRKRHPKLPNGYGSIKFLKNKKRNQYAVHPPTTEFTADGVPKTPKALCYVSDWYTAFEILTAYKAGKYVAGMECTLNQSIQKDKVADAILSDYAQYRRLQLNATGMLFSDVFREYYNDKYVNTLREYSVSSKRYPIVAFKNCSELHDKVFSQITVSDLQSVLDNCPLKHSSLEFIKALFNGMYKYAVAHDITDRELSRYVTIKKPDDDIHGVPFTDSEIQIIWKHRFKKTPARIIIMCLSGFRVASYRALTVHPLYFIGGNKTEAGKGILVPIHESIKELIPVADLPNMIHYTFRKDMYEFLDNVGIPKHTPHDCRHTFSMLCDRYNVNPIAHKKMLGHKIGDVTNDVYGHWDYDMLKLEIEKITVFD